MSEPLASQAAGKVTFPLVTGGTIDILPGVAVILADGGTASGSPVTEISNRRGYVWRVRMDKAAVADALGFGQSPARAA